MTDGLQVVRALLASGAVSPADLEDALQTAAGVSTAPTHREFAVLAEAACSKGSRRTYRTTFRRLVARFADVPVDQVTTAQLSAMATEVRLAAQEAHGGTGVGAEEGFIRGCRFFYRLAVKQGHRSSNPADQVDYSRRNPRVRRALTTAEMQQVYAAVEATSRDPLLDLLLLDFHRDTAARQGGAVALRIRDINYGRGSVLLREKNDKEREVPCARDILRRIETQWRNRTPDLSDDRAFRYPNGRPLTRRRYNTLFGKVHDTVPWAGRLQVSSHWFRHTTLTDVSRATNGRIAAAYAGHTEQSTTDLYTAVTFEELVIAHDIVFPDYAIGEPL